MPGPAHTARRRLVAVVATALLLAAVALADAGLALELAPAGLLGALVVCGWMPGEERLVRAMRRRRTRTPARPVCAPLLRGPQVLAAVGRPAAARGRLRGPPRPSSTPRVAAPPRRRALPATS